MLKKKCFSNFRSYDYLINDTHVNNVSITNIYMFIIHSFQFDAKCKKYVNEDLQMQMKVKFCPCLQKWV
jgi:hypothetical protein